jgi:hypothetical protein
MHAVPQDAQISEPDRGPTVLGVAAAGLLAATVILHVVAMVPYYFGGSGRGSLWSEPDQAAQYAVLAAGWALALGLWLSGPARARVGAAVAVGLAAAELGFRLSDLGEVFRYGSGQAAAGLWIMTAAWVAGATGAGLAVLAVRHRHRRPGSAVPTAALVPPGVLGAGTAPEPASTEPAPADLFASPVTPALGPGSDVTRPLGAGFDVTDSLAPVPDATGSLAPIPDATDFLTAAPAGTGSWGAAPAVLLVVLALATAGAFLPAWDHYAGIATTTGRTLSFNLGNAFSGPWQVVIGNVLVPLAVVVVVVVAVRMRSRALGAALIAGSLIVLATQFTAAVVQVDRAVPPAVAGVSPAQANQLGLQLHMSLTGWFTFDVLAAFALFAAAMMLGHVREVPAAASSAGTWPPAAYERQTASLPWS